MYRYHLFFGRSSGVVMTETETVFFQYPQWLMDIVHKDNSKAMIQAAELYIIAMSRMKLSLKNGFVKGGKPYIIFTYKEIMERFRCKTTKCWYLLKKLKEYGLITVKHQGFGLPMLIFPHGSALIRTSNDGESKLNELKKIHDDKMNKYEFLKEEFNDWQFQKIEALLDEKTSKTENNELKEAFARSLFSKYLKHKDHIRDNFAYFYAIIRKSKFNSKIKPNTS